MDHQKNGVKNANVTTPTSQSPARASRTAPATAVPSATTAHMTVTQVSLRSKYRSRVVLVEDLLIDLLNRAGDGNGAADNEHKAGDGGGVEGGRRGREQTAGDIRRVVVQPQVDGNVVVDAFAGEGAQQDKEREQRDERSGPKEDGLVTKIALVQLFEKAVRQRSFEPLFGPGQAGRPGFDAAVSCGSRASISTGSG